MPTFAFPRMGGTAHPVVVLISSTNARHANGRFHRRCGRAAAQARLVPGGGSSTPEASQIANAKFDVRVCRRWVFEDKFATIMDLRPQCLHQWLVIKFGGGSTMANGNVSREEFVLTHETFYAKLQPFIVRVPSFTVFDHWYLDVYFGPGFIRSVNKEADLKGLEVAEYGLYYLDVGERYNGCARRDMTLPVTEGCVCEIWVREDGPADRVTNFLGGSDSESPRSPASVTSRVPVNGFDNICSSDGALRGEEWGSERPPMYFNRLDLLTYPHLAYHITLQTPEENHRLL
ncbi:hypothetical protein EDB92DRAFT_2116107 [Lactarius akahatsu]|uniref:Uncharacterized protein n=1 Tax=Lactarius akahatsu TaxID=416441 RepID=A0AAD4LG71_9AGAM|nr:hypothetical protein EDB92DRAFT_2116107 [Lactarius akahatsu]